MPPAALLLLLLLPISSLLRLSIATTSSSSNETTSGNNTSCSPATCGALNISYPFSLAGVQPRYCGFPIFQLTCNDGERAYLTGTFRENLYRVHNITYDNSSLVVAVETSFPGEATCHIPDFNVSSGLALFPLNISSSANKDLFFLHNCRHHLGTQLKPPCGNHSALGPYNISETERPGEVGKPPQGLPENCSYVSVPVRDLQSSQGKMDPALDYEGLINEGFVVEVGWPPKSECDQCRGRGGECRFVELSFQCFCPHCQTSRGKQAASTNFNSVLLLL
ncbi:hypothetical protein U9M48_020667 [Paspalum notatum var. saurae]|uniref:Wall-associated receptor kinase galacturonan-binding domain-containing protein n=1 Tax=Paspalum notatum var. saurae TaxID=547442 RepID=A0AAQ3WS98_PASNO